MILICLIILSALFVSYNSKVVMEKTQTTAIADANGVTHYYVIETVSSEKVSGTSLIELDTDKSGKTITEKNGKYVTAVSKTEITDQTEPTENNTHNGNEDNEVLFDTSTVQAETQEQSSFLPEQESPVTENENSQTESVTDSDGWINKWY